MKTGLGGRRDHTDACRMRMEEEMLKHEDTKDRVERARGRIEKWICEDQGMAAEAADAPVKEVQQTLGLFDVSEKC